jgi:hypothetical protein
VLQEEGEMLTSYLEAETRRITATTTHAIKSSPTPGERERERESREAEEGTRKKKKIRDLTYFR